MELSFVNMCLATVMREIVTPSVKEILEEHVLLLQQLKEDGFKECQCCERWSQDFDLCLSCLSRSHCKRCRKTTKICPTCQKVCCVYIMTCYKECPTADCECTRICYFCMKDAHQSFEWPNSIF